MSTRKPAKVAHTRKGKQTTKGANKPGKAKPRKRGRPTLWSPKVAKSIIDQLSSGINLVDICRQPGMPKVRTVNEWAEKRSAFSADFARAREEGCDAIAADCIRIADTPMPGRFEKQELLGILTKTDEAGKEQGYVLPSAELVTTEVRVEDMLGHRKLQIETRLKLLAIWSKRYNPSAKLEVTGKLTLEQLVEQSLQPDAGKA